MISLTCVSSIRVRHWLERLVEHQPVRCGRVSRRAHPHDDLVGSGTFFSLSSTFISWSYSCSKAAFMVVVSSLARLGGGNISHYAQALLGDCTTDSTRIQARNLTTGTKIAPRAQARGERRGLTICQQLIQVDITAICRASIGLMTLFCRHFLDGSRKLSAALGTRC